jgi:hypothetical protein
MDAVRSHETSAISYWTIPDHSTLKLNFFFLWVELQHHRTVPQLTPGFCGAQVRYISIYKMSIYKPSTHMLLKVFMPVAIASVTIPPLSSLTISTPKLYFDSQIPLGGVISSPDLFFYLRLVLDRYFTGVLSYLHCTANYSQIPAFSHIPIHIYIRKYVLSFCPLHLTLT